MIDPLLSLAFTIQANKGVYALLLGSGVSRAAQIPTGWEVVLDLVRKLAHLQSEDCETGPAAWYQSKYGAEPDYSKLLDELAKTPEERQQLLRSYFEPTPAEREQNLKQPTAGHRAIAELVVKGYIRVIVTTNFDRLIERAIEDGGVTPTVVSTADAIEGAVPLVHQQCVVVKIHGDYLDTRIKNTPAELAVYDERVDRMLDRILDEFGIIACGWSAQWDVALCAAFERCKSRRFTTYWAARGKPTDAADRLIKNRAGQTVAIKDADNFFSELGEKVQSLEDFQQPHPLSVVAAEATVKRLMSEERHRIRLHDLVHEETERVYESLQPLFAALLASGNQAEKFDRFIRDMSSRIEVLRTICLHGAFWAKDEHSRLFSMSIERLATDPLDGRSTLNQSLRAIPSVFLLYTSSIAALANGNFHALAAMLTVSLNGDQYRTGPILTGIKWPALQDWFKMLPGRERQRFPLSVWLFEACRQALRRPIPSDHKYEQLFDRFEVLRSLIYADMAKNGKYNDETECIWGPPGRFTFKSVDRDEYQNEILEGILKDELLVQCLLRAGLFLGEPTRLALAINKFSVAACQMTQGCY